MPLPSGVKGKSRAILRDLIVSASAVLNKYSQDQFLRGLYCHYVFDDQKDDFNRLILKLKKIGKFIDTNTCIQMLQGKKEIDGRYFHLSFDDGFRNNYTNAFPILKFHEVPAIFFIPTSLIEANWKDTKKFCLKTTQYTSVIEMLKWEDLDQMISAGYEIGSHTKTHARFSDISHDTDLMRDEILESKLEIEKTLNYKCKYISWPYGRLTDANKTSLEMTKNAGYQACFGAFRGTITPGETDAFSIPRHHFEVQWPMSHIEYFARGNREIVI